MTLDIQGDDWLELETGLKVQGVTVKQYGRTWALFDEEGQLTGPGDLRFKGHPDYDRWKRIYEILKTYGLTIRHPEGSHPRLVARST